VSKTGATGIRRIKLSRGSKVDDGDSMEKRHFPGVSLLIKPSSRQGGGRNPAPDFYRPDSERRLGMAQAVR